MIRYSTLCPTYVLFTLQLRKPLLSIFRRAAFSAWSVGSREYVEDMVPDLKELEKHTQVESV